MRGNRWIDEGEVLSVGRITIVEDLADGGMSRMVVANIGFASGA